MHFFVFLSHPRPDHEHHAKYGGGYINCWIRQGSAEQAEALARQYIQDSGWDVEAREESRVAHETDYADSPDGLACYRKAEAEGSCLVFHTWPVGQDDGQ